MSNNVDGEVATAMGNGLGEATARLRAAAGASESLESRLHLIF